jgi:hypothetical protein
MTILLGALVFASCVILYMLMGALPENQSLLGQLIVLVILVPGGAVPFLAVAWWLRIPELSWLLGDRFLRP